MNALRTTGRSLPSVVTPQVQPALPSRTSGVQGESAVSTPAAIAASTNPPSVVPQVQPPLPSNTSGVIGESPRTPDATVAAMSAAPSVAPQVQPQLPTNTSGVIGESPSTPAAVQAAYSASLGASAPAAPPVSPGFTMPSVPSVVTDPLGGFRSAVNSDVQAEAARGAAVSTPAAAGLAAREMVISPVSRGIEGAVNASAPVRNAAVNAASAGIEGAANAGRSVYQGVRAFITGSAGTPADAPATAQAPAPATAQAPAQVPAQAPAPAVAQAPAVPSVTGASGAPAPAVAPYGNDVYGSPVTSDPQVAAGMAQVQQQAQAAAGATPGTPATPQIPSVALKNPAAVAASYAPGYTPEFHSALGNLMAAGVAIHDAARQNAQNQVGFNDQLKIGKYGQEGAKIEGELQRNTADVARLNAGTDLTKAETKKTTAQQAQVEAQTKNAVQIQVLRDQLARETDPEARRTLEEKLVVLQGGHTMPKVQVVEKQDVDPQTGMVIKTPVIIDANGNARAVQVQGAGASPPGYTLVGKSPDGKKVYKDAQGKQHIEA